MGTTGNEVPETNQRDEEIRIRNLNVIQDFNNKKANSHATIFVASVFALFTVLSLASRIVTPSDCSIQNLTIIGLSIFSYFLIWAFGLYSLGNFTYYSTVASRAETQIVSGMDSELVRIYRSAKWEKVFKIFANFKLNEGQGRVMTAIRNYNEYWSLIVYSIIGFLPLIAFIIWISLG